MSDVRLVATDLDGTLVRSDGTISERTRAALIDVEQRGVAVVFVTGRPLRWAREVFEHVGDHGLAIVSNGALVWDVPGDRARLVRAIPPETGRHVCSLIREAIPGSAFAVEDESGISLEPGFMERFPIPDGTRRAGIDELFVRPAFKLLARHEELDPQTFWTRAEEAVGDRVVITWSSTTSLLEISAKAVTKASTLELLCQKLGISSDQVVAFGDMPNDIPMLEWVGSSYAMSNAHPTVRACAQHVAPSNDDDGVAQVLEGLL